MKRICRAKLHEFEGAQCKECLKLRKYIIKIKNKEWREKNKAKLRENQRRWYSQNKKTKNLYEKNKRKNCYIFKLKKNIRTRISLCVRKEIKLGSAIKDLGCTVEELKLYLESLFQLGMSWDNYGNKEGNWSIDHIIPLSRVNLEDKEQFLKVNHYTNLRPMWHIDNIKKGNKLS